jgi:hypothetical protein
MGIEIQDADFGFRGKGLTQAQKMGVGDVVTPADGQRKISVSDQLANSHRKLLLQGFEVTLLAGQVPGIP